MNSDDCQPPHACKHVRMVLIATMYSDAWVSVSMVKVNGMHAWCRSRPGTGLIKWHDVYTIKYEHGMFKGLRTPRDDALSVTKPKRPFPSFFFSGPPSSLALTSTLRLWLRRCRSAEGRLCWHKSPAWWHPFGACASSIFQAAALVCQTRICIVPAACTSARFETAANALWVAA